MNIEKFIIFTQLKKIDLKKKINHIRKLKVVLFLTLNTYYLKK